MAFYPRGGELVLSKFYLVKAMRGRGYARRMLDFVLENARALGFVRVREEKNDIGGGFFMDDYVYRYALEAERV